MECPVLAPPALGSSAERHLPPALPRRGEERVLAAVRAGASVYWVVRQDWGPSERTVQRWAAGRPGFAEALAEARAAGERTRALAGAGRGMTGWGKRSGEVEDALVARLGEGRALASVCRDADMPSQAVVYAWRRRSPGFDARVAGAMDRRWTVMGEAKGPVRGGRPKVFCDAVAEAIVERLAAGEALRVICREPGMPTPGTVMQWRIGRPGFAQAYDAARTQGIEMVGEEVLEIADALAAEAKAPGWGEIEVARVRIAARRWYAGALACKTGRVLLTPYGEEASPAARMGPEERQARIRELLAKGGYIAAGPGKSCGGSTGG